MARVSIDDTVWRGPREVRLCKLAGKLDGNGKRKWSQRELVGTLAAVWSVCYDQKRTDISGEDIDTAAEVDGFAEAMVKCSLAHKRDDGRYEIAGASERVAYLLSQAERGRKGGETKGKNRAELENAEALARQTLEESEALAMASSSTCSSEGLASARASQNLPSVPDTVPDKVIVPERDSDARVAPPLPRSAEQAEAARIARGQLAAAGWDRFQAIRVSIDPEARPLAIMDSGFTELVSRLRECGDSAAANLKHVLDVAEAEAIRDNSIRWLDGQAFNKKRWDRLFALTVAAVRSKGNPAAKPGIDTTIRNIPRLDL